MAFFLDKWFGSCYNIIMYTTLDPKNKMSMIFIGLALTAILFATLAMISTAKSTINQIIDSVENKEECKCD